jgi:hypothetical protein
MVASGTAGKVETAIAAGVGPGVPGMFINFTGFVASRPLTQGCQPITTSSLGIDFPSVGRMGK